MVDYDIMNMHGQWLINQKLYGWGNIAICQSLVLFQQLVPAPTIVEKSRPPLNERSASVESQFSPRSPFSPLSPQSDDTMSVASSASTMVKSQFKIPDLWRPSIMHCIKGSTEDEQRKRRSAEIRNELVRALVDQMFAFQQPKPDNQFCKDVASRLVRKYPFLKDAGKNVSGYVGFVHDGIKP